METAKTLTQIDHALREAAQRHKFGILNVLDLRQTLNNKGIDLGRECRVYEVCHPQAASTALAADMKVSVVLSCRISIYEDGEKRTIATVKPTDLMKATGLSGVDELAASIERELVLMMSEAK